MIKKIYNYYLIILKIKNKINPSVLASSISFYIVISLIPILSLLYGILNKLELSNINEVPNFNYINIIILFPSLIWSSSKLINNLHLVTNIIYDKEESNIKIRILSIIYTIILLSFIIIMICLILYISYLKTVITLSVIFLLDILQYLLIFFFIVTILSIIYKHIHPIKINNKETIFVSSIITIILFISSIIFQAILKNFIFIKYFNIYGSFTSLVITFLWLYFNCYIFLIGIGIIIYKKMYKQ